MPLGLGLLKQRLIGGGEKEPEELTNKKTQVLALRADIVKVEKSVQAWLNGAQALGRAAAEIEATIGTTDADLGRIGAMISQAMDGSMGSSSGACADALASLKKKLNILDKFKKDLSELENRRLARNRMERKLEDAKKKADQADIEAKLTEFGSAEQSYRSLLGELLAGFDYVLEKANGQGGAGLCVTELTAFKHAQLEFFQNCAKSLEGFEMGGFDLVADFNVFDQGLTDALMKGRSSAVGIGIGNGANNAQDIGSGSSQPPVTSSQQSIASQRPPPPPPSKPASPAGISSQISYPEATALYAYTPENQDELELFEGLKIQVTKKDGDWWEGKANGKTGVFPSNYVQLERSSGGGSFDEDGEFTA